MVSIIGHFGIKMQQVIDHLSGLEDLTNNKNKVVSKKDYELFCKEYLFEQIKGYTFGAAFCKRFGFNDIFLKHLSNETAKKHIELLGYIR